MTPYDELTQLLQHSPEISESKCADIMKLCVKYGNERYDQGKRHSNIPTYEEHCTQRQSEIRSEPRYGVVAVMGTYNQLTQ